MKDDFHFKAYGIEVRASGGRAIAAATLVFGLLILLAGIGGLF